VEERTAALTKVNEELGIFRKFADASGQGFSMADLDGRLLYVNPTLCRILGDSRQEFWIGRHLSICYDEQTNRQGKEEIEPALQQQGHWEGELPMLSRQGQSIPTWHHSFVIRDESGSPLCLAVVITDITERKRAEEALRQSRDELQSIYDGMVDGLHILNLETKRAVRSNPALCRMMGYSKEELLSLTQAEAHPPEELPGILAGFQAHVEGRASLETEVPMLRKDGSVFYADVTTSRIFYNGAPCLMCFFRDRTERRQAQAALERERQSLWRMLQASDHERQTISYEIHDGLAQYLAAAGMQFQVFDGLRESNPEEAKKAYDAAAQLVRQSHAEARRLISKVRPPVIDEIGLETAISHLVHEQRLHGGPKIEFDSNVQFDRLPPILENAVYRIAQEALTNACKHSKSKKVTVTLVQEEQDVRLEVRDWGIGFDSESLPEGHFGLEGIRQRVRLLGGRLTIESTPGRGTSVQVVVPIVERKE
jgi:PAS domain S-box-containing protein